MGREKGIDLTHDRDAANKACHDGPAIVEDFHFESSVDPAEFQKGAAKGGAGETGRRPMREKVASADQNFSRSSADGCNFVNAVLRLYDERCQVWELINLNSVRPLA